MAEIHENRPRSAGRKLEVKEVGIKPGGVKHYRVGECTVLQTHRMHFSISNLDRDPTWEEISSARYALLPKLKDCAMIMPPDDQYANLHEHCFHVFVLKALAPDGAFHSPQGW